jgi:hypothetical protein
MCDCCSKGGWRADRSVVLSSPVVTTEQWQHDADSMIKAMPDSVQRAIAKHEADHTTDSPDY